MVTQAVQIENLQGRIQHFWTLEKSSQQPLKRQAYRCVRWSLMLYREYLRDNVKVRAESLAYLTTFSILPIIAGAFFIFTIFAQFGMVQEAIGSFVNGILDTIPAENRGVIQEYVLKFKDAYLNSISGKSGKLGIFALFVLFWVGLRTFNNIDLTLNQLWSSERERPMLEKVRNFIVTAVGAPVVLIAGLSVPIILHQIPITKALLLAVPALGTILNFIVPVVLILSTFTLLYRLVPYCLVQWKSALTGGIFAALLLQLANIGMNFYFRIGTNTAYGKAAVIPLIGFWIYLVWIIVILGAEVSYLVQNERFYLAQSKDSPSVFELECLLATLLLVSRAHERGDSPVSYERIFDHTNLETAKLRRVLRYLEERNLVYRVEKNDNATDLEYGLARNIAHELVTDLLSDYLLERRPRVHESPIQEPFEKSLRTWIGYFDAKTFAEYVKVGG